MRDTGPELAQFIDLNTLRSLLDSLCRSIGITTVIRDLHGRTFMESNSWSVCRDFFRKNPMTFDACGECDSRLASGLDEGNPWVITTCPNGLVEAAAPVMVRGRRIATVFVGPFSPRPADIEARREQGRSHGFDENAFLAALEEVPVMPETKVRDILTHVVLLVEQLGNMRMNALREREVDQRHREEETYYRDFADSLPVVVFEADLEGRLTFVNRAGSETFGVTSDDLPSGLSVFQMLAPGEQERAVTRLQAIVRGEPIGACEYLARGTDGRLYPVLAHSIPLIRGGRTIGVRGVLFDISQRRQSEQALRDSEERYRLLFENASDAIVILDGDRAVDCNPAALRMYGCTREDIIHQHPSRFSASVQPDGRDAREKSGEMVLKAAPGVPQFFTWRACKLDGAPFEVEVSLSGFETAAGLRVMAVIRDVTERTTAARLLREGELRFRSFYDSNPEGVVLMDLEGRVLDANRAFRTMSGYTSREVKDRLFREFVPEDHQVEADKAIKSLRAGLLEHELLEMAFIRRDGTSVPVSFRGWLVTDEESHPRSLGAFVHDLTRERALAEEKSALERQIRETQKMEAIGTLAGGIAHDFNNILSGIIGFTELAMMDDASNPEGRQRGYLSRVLEASKRARDLVQQILQFSRRTEMPMGVISIKPIVKESIRLLRSTLPATIEIRQNVDAQLDRVVGDPTQIHQVIMNLCTNAYHAMRQGGGTLTIALENTPIQRPREFRSLKAVPGDYIRLSIADTGHGIEPQVLTRIFEPYFTTKKVSEGTGLGLSVTMGIVKNHDGLIEVESSVGQGTRFDVYFPLTEEKAPENEVPTRSLPPGNGEKVLIVDDEPFFLEVVRMYLESLGYQVTAKHSSLETLETFRGDPNGFDLVITDQTMPEMTGVQLAGEIRTFHKTIPIILCTGYSETVTEQSARYFGITGFLMKPVVCRDLAWAVHEALQQGR
jgi:PAS domain S-box-containing protein